MDDKYKDYLSYLEFLHRIGRRVGYKSEATSESMKMTREEQIRLSGLLMREQGISDLDQTTLLFLVEMMINNTEQTRADFIKCAQENLIDRFYNEVETLLEKITKAEISNE